MDSENDKDAQCPRDVKKQFKNQILIPTLLNFGQAIGMIFISVVEFPREDTPPIAEILWVKNGRAIVVCGFLIK